jgi:hypothetical protein
MNLGRGERYIERISVFSGIRWHKAYRNKIRVSLDASVRTPRGKGLVGLVARSYVWQVCNLPAFPKIQYPSFAHLPL